MKSGQLTTTALASLTALAAVLCAGCNDRNPALAIAPHVELERFMGDWYVIASIPTRLERGAHNAVESYQLLADGTIDTTFTFNDGAAADYQRLSELIAAQGYDTTLLRMVPQRAIAAGGARP